MFLEKFDAEGVVRGPARQGRGAFVSREDAARTAAAVLRKQPGGTYDVTGPEALSVAEIARRLSTLVGRQLRYEDESADAARERLSKLEPLPWRVDSSSTFVNLMSQCRPEHEALQRPELRRRVTRQEHARAVNWARQAGLAN